MSRHAGSHNSEERTGYLPWQPMGCTPHVVELMTYSKGITVVRSQYILGRRAAMSAFRKSAKDGSSFTVTAYAAHDGIRFTDPVIYAPQDHTRDNPLVKYRIRVTAKKAAR